MTPLDHWIIGGLMFVSLVQSAYIVWHARTFHAGDKAEAPPETVWSPYDPRKQP